MRRSAGTAGRPRRRARRQRRRDARPGPIPRAVSHPDCLTVRHDAADQPSAPESHQVHRRRWSTTGSRAYRGCAHRITAGSEFHRVPPARGGLRPESCTQSGDVATAEATYVTAGATAHGSSRVRSAARRRSIATYEPGWLLATFFISEATAITSRGSVNRRPLGVDCGHADGEGDQGGPVLVAAPVGHLDVAALRRRPGRRAASAACLEVGHRALGQRQHLVGRADEDEVVAADVAEEDRRQARPSTTARCRLRASAVMNSSPRSKPYTSLTLLNRSMSM